MRPVQVVVVAFHGAEELAKALSGLAGRFPVLVVDNSSSPAVRAAVAAHGGRYEDARSNRGFGSGVNVALRLLLQEEPGDVLVLNPDALIDPEGVERLAQDLHAPEHSRVAVLSPRVLDEDRRPQQVAWPFPSPAAMWRESLGLPGRTAKQYVIGAVMLLRWEALLDVGLFDERFFLYGEETDWQRRATRQGWRSLESTAVQATHVGAGTSADKAHREALFYAGQETYIRKWHGASGWASYRLALLLGSAARALVLPEPRRSHARLRVRLLLRGPRRAAGLA